MTIPSFKFAFSKADLNIDAISAVLAAISTLSKLPVRFENVKMEFFFLVCSR